MMRKNGTYFGKGDFKKIIDLLAKKGDYKDVARKLRAIKDGCLFEKAEEKKEGDNMGMEIDSN